MSDQTQAPTTCDDRRTFFTRLTLGLGGLIGAILAVPAVGFVLGPLIRKPERIWREVHIVPDPEKTGKRDKSAAAALVDDFEIGETVLVEFEDPSPKPWAGLTATTAAWVRRESTDGFIAFSINCRHLGCPVRWVAGSELFMCPCHGGVYYSDGEVAAGPPPQGLQKYPIRVENGQVQIETSPVPLPSQKSHDA
ncbi:MAG: Rieske (2Fe-2S) protein [Pirellulales bacterium]|nr:Rieske (2Fe-2S) protein [Pirellulales bacterium]